jgi:ubiquinol-cytochrome c reductase cytochrome c1 subunit
MKKWTILLSAGVVVFAGAAFAGSGGTAHNKKVDWHFDGVLGTVDRQSAQRGFQVYKEVCAACHSLKLISFRNLQSLGFSEGEVKAIAAEYSIQDGPNDAGDMFERPGRPSDNFPAPYANDKAARVANNGALPPDLSLMVKARVDGANYLHSLLTGYETAPEGFQLSEGMHYNPYFPGGQIAMPKPISDGQVTYGDGTVATADQMSQDLVNFLQWTAEPEMEDRKSMGIKVFLYLLVFTGLFIAAKKRIWCNIEK